MSNEEQEEIILHGVAASPGVAHGHAFVYLQRELEIPLYKVDPARMEDEIRRFEQALMETRQQIGKVRSEVASKLGEDEAQIFDAHLLVLEDRALIEETINELNSSGFNIEYCFHAVSRRFIEAFDALDDEYIKERVTDIRDVAKRVLQNLLGHRRSSLAQLSVDRVVVSEDLSPSDTAGLDKSNVLGLVTDVGSRTSHAVIMARSLQVPAVVGLHDATARIEDGDQLIVDGYDGVVIIHPSETTLFRYGRLKKDRQTIERMFRSVRTLPAQTADGVTVQLFANIGGPDELPQVEENGAEGIGLFRTEALFLRGDCFPSEEEQYAVYSEVAKGMAGQAVIIRTMDLGGDKRMSSFLFSEDEENPFMGFRAIRFCLEHREVFRDQLRAILRASVHGDVRIMYPMISGPGELIQANEVLEQAKAELVARGESFNANIKVGSMIEIPSAAYTIDLLAEHCSFFSIGTNDLIQYLLAVDRVNDRIAHLYQPAHPAVLRTIAHVIREAKKKGVSVGVCGEMAGDPLYVPFLFGLGAHDISLSAPALPEIKYLVRTMKMADAEQLVEKVLAESDPLVIEELMRSFYHDTLGDLLKDAEGTD